MPRDLCVEMGTLSPRISALLRLGVKMQVWNTLTGEAEFNYPCLGQLSRANTLPVCLAPAGVWLVTVSAPHHGLCCGLKLKAA